MLRICPRFGACQLFRVECSFTLSCTASALCRAAERLAGRSRGLLDILKLQLPGRKVVHADETGWWLGGKPTYLHVFGVDDIVIFQVGNRSNDLALEILGAHFDGLVEYRGLVVRPMSVTILGTQGRRSM